MWEFSYLLANSKLDMYKLNAIAPPMEDIPIP